MAESVRGDAEVIQTKFLWQELEETFRKQADTLGVQLFSEEPHTNLLLVSEPVTAYENETYQLRLWGRWISGLGIVQATLIYDDFETGATDFIYEITPEKSRQWVKDTASTLVDIDDLLDIRDDIEHVIWDPDLSQSEAEESIFFT